MANWLVTSIVLSVVLTVVLNVVLRAVPGAGRRSRDQFDRLDRRLADQAAHRPATAYDGRRPRRVQVFFPWKAMLLVSLFGTLLLNALIRLF